MRKTMRRFQFAFVALLFAGSLLSLPLVSRAAALPSGAGLQAQQEENSITAAAQARLNKKQYKDIHVSVENGVATLTGTVDLAEYKLDAAKSVLHAKGVVAVRNQIEVSGPTVPDQELQAKLSKKLEYDRVGYGNVFDAIG